MKQKKIMAFGLLAAFCLNVQAAPVITKDYSGQNSVLLSDFTSAPSAAYKNAKIQGTPSGGTTIYESNGTALDPQLTFNGSSLDLTTYSNFRARWKITNPGGNVSVWRNPAAAGQNLSLNAGSGFVERQGTIPNPIATATGFRVDPVGSGTTWTMELDYIYADRGRTIGIEYDHDGDLNGTTLSLISPSSVSGGILSGTASGTGDSKVLLAGVGTVNADIYKYVEIRVKGNSGDRIDYLWNTAIKGGTSANTIDSSADGEWHTYLLDYTDDAQWTGNLTANRFDPLTSTGGTFAVDYIRFMETIPEPATLGMIVAMGAGILFVRRLMM